MSTATVNGIDLFYELAGPQNAPLVAFSNSLGSTTIMWDAVVPALAGRYRCLTYDTRGHGRSGSSDRPASIDDLADDLAGLLDILKVERAHIVGLSLGGMTGQALASRKPERVASLTLIATSAYLPPVDFWHTRAATVKASGPEAVVDQIIPRWFTEAFRSRDPDAVARVRDELMGIDRAGYGRCCEAIAAMDLRDRLSDIAAPTLVMVGAEDPVTTPAMAEALRAGIANAELVVIPKVAHLISVERPEAVAAHLGAFLGRCEPKASADAEAFEKGLAVRRAVLGATHVDAALKNAGSFGGDWQDFITRLAWGEIWADPTLTRKTRSLVTVGMMIALHREEEFKLHVRAALGNGVTVAELKALIRQAAVYAGVPAGNAAMRWAREVLGEEAEE
jgi:3-oxoadipate enol-lactonase/4-carboxymuconolactone decarboxylase